MKKAITTVVVSLLTVVVIVLIIQYSAPKSAQVGYAAPDFRINTINHEQTVSLHDYDESFIIVNLWASWCDRCKDNFPLLDDLDDYYDDEQVKVLAVNVESLEFNDHGVAEFLQEQHYNLSFLQSNEAFETSYPYLTGVPTTYFIDEDNIVIDAMSGELNSKAIEKKIEHYFEYKNE
ncbi:TlpA disulfide reductase family protein [Geomicrobium sp. JCM 19038]|uniref:TlpA family protein disulfide reductase n=1 Tax=Geomicrobium sp. JCM 19038 TaxID=1460635 RepID=UPI00045F4D03|nr:TlpA disulfide reductase family protein [Geomicrobium sp. JCM 19038]GAK09158.1 thiol:disulfide oxidoreductase [Geomicrobium sp. JCM 19038]